MNEIARIDPSDLLANPPLMKPAMQDAERIIDLCARMERWEAMEQAIDWLIECQQTVVEWWDDHVQPAGRAPKGNNPAPRLITASRAQDLLSLRQQQISRIRQSLADVSAYRLLLIRRAKREAGISTISEDPSAMRPTPSREGEPDFWATPPCLTAALIEHVLPILPDGPIWECAAGDNRLAKAISTQRDVFASDLYPHEEVKPPRDFLTTDPPTNGTIVVTNPPYNNSDAFIERGLSLFDQGETDGLVLLLRHDHMQASGRVDAFNRATVEVHCNWRPIWIDGTDGQPRWSFHWIVWTNQRRRAPIYLTQNGRDT